MESSLDQLKSTGTTVVCDSGDFQAIGKYNPCDATTNPSLILAASEKPEYARLIDIAVDYGKSHGSILVEQVDTALDRVLVEFGKEIMHIIPGRVSTEVDARFSFDIQANIKKALGIISLYEEQCISKDRVLIKLASTWEGIQAAKILQEDYGIDCNMTLVFSLTQAIAAAEAGAFVTSPFVGRILDWHKATEKKDYTKDEDPGVLNVKAIFNYYKRYGYRTRIMGASFRNVGEVTELAGCDYLTISPSILEQLYQSTDPVVKKLDAAKAFELNIQQKSYLDDESLFRFDFNENRMAVEELREGISKFARDASILKDMLRKRIEAL